MATRQSKFLTPRTALFYSRLTQEYTNAMGQSILYYKLNGENSHTSSKYEIYRETVTKLFYPPIEVTCSVNIAPKQTELLEDVGHELRTSADVYIHREELKKLDLYPEIGDIFSYQRTYFEIFDLDDSPELHGNPEYQHTIILNAIDIRINDTDIQLMNDVDYKEATPDA